MAKGRLAGALLLLVCGGISLWWGAQVARSGSIGMLDFKALYYSTSSLMHHKDPYDPVQLRAFCAANIENAGSYPHWMLYTLGLIDYLPTLFPLVAPFALMPWGPAHIAWFAFSGMCLMVATALIGMMTTPETRPVTLWLLAIFLANLELLFGGGNAAALVVGLAGVAVWCFVRERFAAIGVLCLAATLAIKPHDTGLLWLFFLLSGRARRRRALETLALDVMLAVLAVGWVSHVAPHWVGELRSNVAIYDGRGGANSPEVISTAGSQFRSYGLAVFPGMVIGLESAIAPLVSSPRVYAFLTYLITVPLLVVWIFTVWRSRYTLKNAYLAIAAIVPLTLLLTYHRTTDAKLLLLTIPACAMLWAEGGRAGKAALILTSAGILLTGDITLTLMGLMIGMPDWSSGGLMHRAGLVILTRPIPLVLLAMAVFYLRVYVTRAGRGAGTQTDSAGL